ncbi:helix-turn-helix domain-containing protein [Rhizobium sp. SSA_523]|uniref:helix-turn-helix domain-containing protein n=1 Tax=Rhizobium sp. SSA_523 TaxID=2952477 RepID=UPI0020919357|nr:helix-turn-helix domain-containing protein [Rhizobium sp. SSA_523]MCO5731416.1 helix-turn-helix domain-containing protein [Rhizobium sp. SSA_523]WKC22060.1 helix-turn-helix domain-containing protein [Rhizobium sp. SSA_523]
MLHRPASVNRLGAEPVHPHLDPSHPLVVYGDHQFCAGKLMEVQRMAGPHMHTQIELNFVLGGRMTYWFDGSSVTIGQGRLCLFWGMVPHQVTERAEGTRFVCLYVPMSVFLGHAGMGRLRHALFRGAVIEAVTMREWETDIFLRWREELLSGQPDAAALVRMEVMARMMRIELEGWRDLREAGTVLSHTVRREPDLAAHVETMLRFVGEHALGVVSAEDVARAAGLHPNYAMTLFRRSVGMTINQAIIRHRLDTAQSLLMATDLPITQIAYESGFGSLSSFYEAFHRRFGEKPVQMRRRLRPPAGPPHPGTSEERCRAR